MKNTIFAALTLLTFLAMSPTGWARFIAAPDMASSWAGSSIVVLGRVRSVEIPEKEKAKGWGRYEVEVEKFYKGELAQDKLGFIQPFDRSEGAEVFGEGERCLIFLQTVQDRKKTGDFSDTDFGAALTLTRSFSTDRHDLAAMEEAITLVTAYRELPESGQKAFLLENLANSNSHVRSLIDREIVRIRMTEAIPYYREKLRQAADDESRRRQISTLRLLGDPGVKATLLEWLNGDSFKPKRDVLEELVALGDKSVVPEIRKWIDAKDDQVVVAARSALLRLGEADAKGLLLEMIQRSNDPIARYNAIHFLHWNNRLGFTDEEIAAIQPLVDDQDESVARVAGFIVEEWNRKAKLNSPDDRSAK